jgi:hypothetical protein
MFDTIGPSGSAWAAIYGVTGFFVTVLGAIIVVVAAARKKPAAYER